MQYYISSNKIRHQVSCLKQSGEIVKNQSTTYNS